MYVRGHKLWGSWYKLSPNHSDREIVPRFIVMHYTAGWSGAGTRDYFMSRKARASSHLVLDRSGELWQLVPFNKRAWHAGPSRFGGYTDLNSHSIGIEIDNPGYLRPRADGGYLDWERRPVPPDRLKGYTFEVAPHSRIGARTYAWAEYPEEQLSKLDEIVQVLLDAYPTIRDIVSHEEIDTRGWKTDPGPAFPMRRYQHLLQGRDRSIERELVVTAGQLNVRGGPGTEFEKLSWGPLARGSKVVGVEQHGVWWRIRVMNDEGWAHGLYLQDA